MDDSTPQQTAPRSKRDEELDKAFVADFVDQPQQLDKLARVVLTLSIVVPTLYALGLKFFSGADGAEASVSGIWLMGLAFSSWFVSLLLSLLVLLSGKGKRNTAAKSSAAGSKPETVALYLASARSKRRRLLAASLFCFTGICFAVLTVFSAAFSGL
ncbi:MAG: hypothetical protein HGB35_04465 [Geobacteraceae bacterium]|nr:hypothetical protein [Geobacteraceae bacterium]